MALPSLLAIPKDGPYDCNFVPFSIPATLHLPGTSPLEVPHHVRKEPFLSLPCWDWLSPLDCRKRCFCPSPTRSNIKNHPAIISDPNKPLNHTLNLMQQQNGSLTQMVMDNQLVLDFLLAKQGGIFSQGTSCHLYSSNSRQVQANLQKMHQDLQVMHHITKIFQQIPPLL